MTGSEVATRGAGSGTLALRGDQGDWTEPQRAALAQIGVADAPVGDQMVLLHVAQRTGLDPFARQIYMIGRNDRESGGTKWTIQTGIDGFRVVSERHPQYAGVRDAEWCGDDGVWRDVWVGKQPPAAARFTVIRRDWEHPVRAVAHYDEYVQTKYNGDPNKMWATKPAHMLAKCAEALARRRAFPQDLAAVYTDDEMAHADNPPRVVVQSQREQQPAAPEPDWDALIGQHEAAQDRAKLGELWKLARGMRPNDLALQERIARAGERVKAATIAPAQQTPDPAADASTQPVGQAQMRRIFALLKKRGVEGDEAWLRAATHALDRDITSFKELSANDASTLIARLEKLDSELGSPPSTADESTVDSETETVSTEENQD